MRSDFFVHSEWRHNDQSAKKKKGRGISHGPNQKLALFQSITIHQNLFNALQLASQGKE